MRVSLIITIAFTLIGTTTAAPIRTSTYVEAMTAGKQKTLPIAVYIHGSSWHPASKTFGEKIWRSPAFTSALKDPIVLTNIHIKQHLNKEQAKAESQKYKGWNAKTIRTYPAVQIYASDGHLLKTYTGRELRILTSPESLATHINHITTAATKRRALLAKIKQARTAKNTEDEIKHLVTLIELPLNNEPKIVAQLKKADPNDTTGWQARLSFRNWEFVRHITGLINNKKTDQALTEIDKLLATSHHTPEQRTLILGAKGKALASQGKLTEAWHSFQEAQRVDPKGPNGKAMFRYGTRIAGIPSREAFPNQSTLRNKPIGSNLSRDHATFTMSSAASDNPKEHPTLFKGNYARSGYAFHTDAEKNAHIIVDLKSPCQVKALRIVNRNNIHERAKTLTVWASTDQKSWQKIWAAKAAAPEWDIPLESPVTARYLKVGLNSPTPEHLHLRAVDVYGTRP